jgi:AraC family transcriptional regulator of adaptative response / DNA-3-methyladenine glycosylase II
LLRELPAQGAYLGIMPRRVQAIAALAHRWPELQSWIADRPEPAFLIERLQTVPGIGPWTAHYIAMRTLAWPNAFLPKDVALLNALRQGLGIDTWSAAQARFRAWEPWRSYAVLRWWRTLAPRPS